MKKITSYILVLFFIILLAVPLTWVLNVGAEPEESVVEARTLVAMEPVSNPNLGRALNFIDEGQYLEAAKILIDLYTSASFTNKFEQATSDQFPFRLSIINFSKSLDRMLIKLAYNFTRDSVIPADMTSDIYYDSTNDQLIFAPTIFNDTTKELINTRIKNYEALITSHPTKNFYLFYHQTLENSEYHPLNSNFKEADAGQALEYFEENLPDGLVFGKFELTGIESHLQNYYRTDHHWNVYGILHAYEDIHNLLNSNFKEITPMLEIEEIMTFEDINFLGLMTRRTLYPINGEKFAVEVVEFPTYEIAMNGQEIEEMPRNNYFSGNYSTAPYTNHYNEFYGYVTGFTEYTNSIGPERNILIIGSSYRYALDPLIASHYNRTYSVDLRYYTDFSLSYFLNNYEVDDILIIGHDTVAFEDIEYWTINP